MLSVLEYYMRATVPENILGKTYGYLTVIRFINKEKYKSPIWECICECGNVCKKNYYKLIGGITVSCGCRISISGNKNTRWTGTTNGKYTICGAYFYRLERLFKMKEQQGLAGSLSREQVFDLWKSQDARCSLSNLSLHLDNDYHTATLDRIDNSVGYTLSNVHFIHKDINKMKLTYNMTHFIHMMELIHKPSLEENQNYNIIQKPKNNRVYSSCGNFSVSHWNSIKLGAIVRHKEFSLEPNQIW